MIVIKYKSSYKMNYSIQITLIFRIKYFLAILIGFIIHDYINVSYVHNVYSSYVIDTPQYLNYLSYP